VDSKSDGGDFEMARMTTKPDSTIQQGVIQELRWDTRVAVTDVGVEVDRGVVTLTGTVDSYAKLRAAQEAAHRVVGVLDVANDIRVHPLGNTAPTDTEIAQAIRNVLRWDAHVPHEQIETTVSGAWVTLEGTVSFWHQRREAERVVLRLAGVRGVTNRILVATPDAEPEVVRRAIEEALERRAERECRDLQVKVHDGKVTLSGHVQSWREKRAVLGAASHAPGVRDIEDYVRVDLPYF
jgi:osmotically-inducible protein OsmY